MSLEPGTLLAGRWRIEATLGHGGMATVYRAVDTRSEATVALKRLHPHLASQPGVSSRFAREVLAARLIDHPNVVRVHELVEHDGEPPFLVMELVEAPDLKFVVRAEGRLDPARVVRIGLGAAAGLTAAHAAGVLHGDVKPHNLLLESGAGGAEAIKLIDLGMARVETTVGLSTHSLVLGTPEYAAPELFTDRFLDARGDVYGLGATLYELVTGRPPFRGGGAFEVLQAKAREDAPSPRARAPDCPDWLDRVVRQAMAPAPEDRIPTMEALAAALRAGVGPALGPRAGREGPGSALEAAGPSCPGCAAPLVVGLGLCVTCGREDDRIRPREGGRHLVWVRRTGWARGPNPTDILTYQQKYAIARRVQEALGQASVDDRRLDVRLKSPPFVVVDGLSERDAHRLVARLESEGVKARAERRGVRAALRVAIGTRGVLVATGLGLLVLAPALVALSEALRHFPLVWPLVGVGGLLGTVAATVAWRMRPLTRLAGRGRPLPVGRAAEEDEAAVAWLGPIARRLRDQARSPGLLRTLGRLVRRAAALERSLLRLDWIEAELRARYRGELGAALQQAGVIAAAIQRTDDYLTEADEAELHDRLAHAHQLRAALALDEDPSEALAALAEAEAALDTRAELEASRARSYSGLLRLVARLDALHARLARVADAEGRAAAEALAAAMSELEADLEAVREVESL